MLQLRRPYNELITFIAEDTVKWENSEFQVVIWRRNNSYRIDLGHYPADEALIVLQARLDIFFGA